MYFNVICVDDICPENIQYFWPIKIIRNKYPKIRIIAFVIANYNNAQNIRNSSIFQEWFKEYHDIIEIGVHGYDHLFPPEQERDNAEELTKKSLEIIRPYLKSRFLYRPPGHQRTIYTERILRKLGFGGIAYQTRIKYFDTGKIEEGILNLHCTNNKYENPIIEVYKNI